MLTIGRRYRGSPRGDVRAECDYCGVAWHRSQLRRDAAGYLYCPDEGSGRDQVTLSRLNAAAARSVVTPRVSADATIRSIDNTGAYPFSQVGLAESDWVPGSVSGVVAHYSAQAREMHGATQLAVLRNTVTGSRAMVAPDPARRPVIEAVSGVDWIRCSGDATPAGSSGQYMRSNEGPWIASLASGFWVALTVRTVTNVPSSSGHTALMLSTGTEQNYAIVATNDNGDLARGFLYDGTTDEYLWNAADEGGSDPDPADTSTHLIEYWYDGSTLNREYDASGTVRTDTDVSGVSLDPFDRLQLFARSTSGIYFANAYYQDIVIATSRPTGDDLAYIRNRMLTNAGIS